MKFVSFKTVSFPFPVFSRFEIRQEVVLRSLCTFASISTLAFIQRWGGAFFFSSLTRHSPNYATTRCISCFSFTIIRYKPLQILKHLKFLLMSSDDFYGSYQLLSQYDYRLLTECCPDLRYSLVNVLFNLLLVKFCTD